MTTPSPLVVSVHDLGRGPGASRALVTTVPAPAGIGAEVLQVPDGSDLELDLRLDSVLDGIYLTGDVTALLTGACGRCLGEIDEDLVVDVSELVLYPDRRDALVAEGDEEMTDAPVVTGETIDLEPLLRDALVLAMPFQPLCRPDCPGLCAECGERWDDLPADHAHEILDPRWAALAGLASGDVPEGDGAAARGAGSPDVGDTVGASGEDESGADR